MRHWRSALDQIYEHNATRAVPGYGPQTDTEKALVDALKELELQCKERLDLLEALRASRDGDASSDSAAKSETTPRRYDSPARAKGSIGDGTIPAVTYSELSRPAVAPRPSIPARTTSEQAQPVTSSVPVEPPSYGRPEPRSLSPGMPQRAERNVRSTSPDKHTMRTTLRPSKFGEKSSGAARKSAKPAAEGPSKAATLAWSALGPRERLLRSPPSDGVAGLSNPKPRQAGDQLPKQRSPPAQWDSHSRRLVPPRDGDSSAANGQSSASRHSDEFPYARPSLLSVSAASSALSSTTQLDVQASEQSANRQDKSAAPRGNAFTGGIARNHRDERSNGSAAVDDSADLFEKRSASDAPVRRKAVSRRLGQEAPAAIAKPKPKQPQPNGPRHREKPKVRPVSVSSTSGDEGSSGKAATGTNWKQGSRAPRSTGKLKAAKRKEEPVKLDSSDQCSDGSDNESSSDTAWKKKKASILKNLPAGVDESAAKQILNDIVVQGDEVRWGDIAGLEVAKNALRETVVYPFLRPDLFMGLREPARGMLLFGPPGTGKTMLARAVATESKSTFFSISASSLTSKYLGESEKLVRALFGLARYLAPSIIFVDEIDSLLSQRAGSGEHEATRRIKTEFLIQWSDLQRAAAGRETTERDRERGDANRVLVLAATNLPWAIDEAARRRFVRRQYIPLPEPTTRETQIRTLLGEQKHGLSNDDILKLVVLTDGKSLTVFTRNTSLICT